jgi:hypothetical protein
LTLASRTARPDFYRIKKFLSAVEVGPSRSINSQSIRHLADAGETAMIDILSAALASQLALRKSHVSPGCTDGLLGRPGNGYPAGVQRLEDENKSGRQCETGGPISTARVGEIARTLIQGAWRSAGRGA